VTDAGQRESAVKACYDHFGAIDELAKVVAFSSDYPRRGFGRSVTRPLSVATSRRGYRHHRDRTVAGNRDTQIGSAVRVVKACYDTAAGDLSCNRPIEPSESRLNSNEPIEPRNRLSKRKEIPNV
jgi:hypothetical protein